MCCIWNLNLNFLRPLGPRMLHMVLLSLCLSKGPAPAAATALSHAACHAASLRHPVCVRDLLEPPLALDR